LLAADPDVAPAVDKEPGVTAKLSGHQVGGQALAGAAGVEPDARWADDRATNLVDSDRAPASIGMRSGGPARRRVLERGSDRCGRGASARAAVAGGLDLTDQRWVDQAARTY
jgi:hypothetical protein